MCGLIVTCFMYVGCMTELLDFGNVYACMHVRMYVCIMYVCIYVRMYVLAARYFCASVLKLGVQ
jgi:hypothetical protein